MADPEEKLVDEYLRRVGVILDTSYANEYNITDQELSGFKLTLEREGGNASYFNRITESQIDLDVRLKEEDLRLKDWLTDDEKEKELTLFRMDRYRQQMKEAMIWYELRKKDFVSVSLDAIDLRGSPESREIVKPARDFLWELRRRIEHLKTVYKDWEKEERKKASG
jgi:hypothetical protein